MWDYLMLEMEFLELYVEGMSTEDIGLASDIDVVMKEHPKGLTQTHLQLLRYKKEQLNKHIMVSKYSPLLQNSDSRVLISPVSNEFY